MVNAGTHYRWLVRLTLLWLCSSSLALAQSPSADQVLSDQLLSDQVLRQRAAQALQLIERSSAEYLKQRECFACHHQAMTILTGLEARARGLAVDHDNLVRQVERTIEHLRRGESDYRQGKGQGGKVDTAGYALLALATAGWPADATTDAVAEYLLQANADKQHWVCSGNRPPTEANDTTTSALALMGLKAYAREQRAQRAKPRIQECRQWLAEHPPEDNEQRVFALMAARSVADTASMAALRDSILAQQRDDGGWSQTEAMPSDAYATGTSLVALAQAGTAPTHPNYQRGLRYLIESQLPDGSWHVTTRSRPIQKYFESGFPHGADQFISMAATSWSTLALMLALPRNQQALAAQPELPWLREDAQGRTQAAAVAATAGRSEAKQPRKFSAQELEFFERDIRPLLAENCASCHGAEKQSADLRVDSLSALLRGGESGPALVPGAAQRSLILRAVRREGDLQMPPDDPLSEEQIDKLKHWIELGAPWPQDSLSAKAAGQAEPPRHWAFQPLVQPAIPDLAEASPVDSFVGARLGERGLAPAAPAGRHQLLRRLSYDLVGLPPTVEQQEAFAADDRPDAYERVVDRLLASPRLGEQWGRHWLDVARYSDTKGYVYAREERFFVHAAAYRDWVIDALAMDLPFDRFVRLQLAADQIAPDDPSAQAAMGFLTVGRRFLGVTHDIIDDRIDVVSRGLLGLTVACARCHDHKFDPIPTDDYYALYGVFHNSVEQRVPLTDQPSADAAFEAELAKRQQAYRERLAEERRIAAERVHQRITEYLVAQLELDKYPAEGFDIIIGKDDLVPAHVRRFQTYLMAAAEREDAIFAAWRRFEQLAADTLASAADNAPTSDSQAATPAARTIADVPLDPEAAAEISRALAGLSPERCNVWVLRQFSAPPRSMREVAQGYGELFSKLNSDQPEKNFAAADRADRRGLAELVEFWQGPLSPCSVPDEDIVSTEQFFDSKTCEALWKLQGEIDRWINASNVRSPLATVLTDRREILEPHVFRRGNPRLVGRRVPRQFLTLFSPSSDGSPKQAHSVEKADSLEKAGDLAEKTSAFEVPPFHSGSGRRELAEAIVDPRNPLTTRVWGNRVWQHLFGQGLVTTPSDFGLRADPPSHPELLDWLARDFLAHQQSTHHLIRQLVLSSCYRQSATVDPSSPGVERAVEMDPDNRLLWRANTKRLSFEQQRDTWLMVAQQLDSVRGGRAQALFGDAANHRRSIYGLVDRQFLPGVLRVFDFANPDLHTPQRSETTVPQQALFELNHPFAADIASGVAEASAQASTHASSTADAAGAEAVTSDSTEADWLADSEAKRIERMFNLVLARRPTPSELADAREFLQQPIDAASQPRAETLAWQYGVAQFDPERGELSEFMRLPVFTGSAWQGGAKWPDKKLGWALLTAEGGHAGNDLQHAVVRRWMAPEDGTVTIRSQAFHEVAAGDGVRCSIVASRGGLLASAIVHNGSAELHIAPIELKAGDTLDFVVDYHANLNNDQFRWAPAIVMADRTWDAQADFAGPPPKLLDRWQQLAQVLLLSNELMFVD